MTTVEKLFVQIFERKNWIVEQVKQQTDLYNQQLASKLLIDGITPPPWLWSPNSYSQSSDPKELNKEELISKILLRKPRESVAFSNGGCSLYDKAVVSADNGGIPGGLCIRTNASITGNSVRDRPSIVLDGHGNDDACTLHRIQQQDDSVNSPQDEADVRISNIYAAADQSLARIQRSRSRQKALELRSSAKAAGQSCLSHDNETRISFSGVSSIKTGPLETDQNKSSSKSPIHFGASGGSSMLGAADTANYAKKTDISSHNDIVTISRSSFEQPINAIECIEVHESSEKEKEDDSLLVQSIDHSLQLFDQVNGPIARMNPHDATSISSGEIEATVESSLDKPRGSNIYCGRMTRSRSSSQQHIGISKSSKPCPASSYAKEGSGRLSLLNRTILQQLDAPKQLMEAVKPSSELTNKMTRVGSISSNEGTRKPVKSSNIDAFRVTRSRSLATKDSLNVHEGYALQNTLGSKSTSSFIDADVNHERSAETAERSELADEPVQMQPVHSVSNLDNNNQRIELEGLVSIPPLNDFMVVKPRQLDFDSEECTANDPMNGTPGKSSEKACLTAPEPSVSLHALSHSNLSKHFSGQKSPVGTDEASRREEAQKHYDVNIDEDGSSTFGSDRKEHSILKNMEYCMVAPVHTKADIGSVPFPGNNSDEEVHPGKCELTEGFQSSLRIIIAEELAHKRKSKTAVSLSPPTLKYSEASFRSSLIKERTDDPQDCLLKESEVHKATDLPGEDSILSCASSMVQDSIKLASPKMSFKSVKPNSWPPYKRRKVEDQENCFSASRGHKVQLNAKDTVNIELIAPGNDSDSTLLSLSEEIYASQSNAKRRNDSEIHRNMKCVLTEAIESSDRLQAAKESGLELENKTAFTTFTLKQLRATRESTLTSDIPTAGVVEDTETVDRNRDAIEASNLCLEQDYNASCHYEDTVSKVNTNYMNAGRSFSIRESSLIGDPSLSYFSVGSPHKSDDSLIGSDETMPVFEGFIIDEQKGNTRVDNAECGINFGSLELASTAFQRASILEQICKSASTRTPLSQFSSSFQLKNMQDLYHSVPNGLLEHFDLRSTLPFNGDGGLHLRSSYNCVDEINSAVQGLPISDSLPSSGTPFRRNSSIHYASPVGKFWESFSSSSGSSEKRLSSNPELTCFPIKEDPNSNEENDNAEELADENQDTSNSGIDDGLTAREPLGDITEACLNPGNSVAAAEKFPDRGSLDSCNTDFSFPGTNKKMKQKVGNYCSTKISTNAGKENQAPSFGAHRVTRSNASLNNNEFCKPKLSSKASLRNGLQSLSQKEAKRNNIVSNMTSFVPLVQQKQATAVCTGKREIKLKCLEAAEAAKRREEEKEKERKMKKEALKLERARIEKENLREMELIKKKKQEEQKKKDADKASRKRQREEEERVEKEKKRKHVAETRKEQKLQDGKLHAGKVEKDKLHGKMDKKVTCTKESGNASVSNHIVKESMDRNNFEKHDVKLQTGGISTSSAQQASTIIEDSHASISCGGEKKAMSTLETSTAHVDFFMSTNQEKSYDMSPYQCSDDEEEEEDDVPTKKFVPSWASKNNVALVLPLQQKLAPDRIFPLESFCSMDEVLLPRRLQLKEGAI